MSEDLPSHSLLRASAITASLPGVLRQCDQIHVGSTNECVSPHKFTHLDLAALRTFAQEMAKALAIHTLPADRPSDNSTGRHPSNEPISCPILHGIDPARLRTVDIYSASIVPHFNDHFNLLSSPPSLQSTNSAVMERRRSLLARSLPLHHSHHRPVQLRRYDETHPRALLRVPSESSRQKQSERGLQEIAHDYGLLSTVGQCGAINFLPEVSDRSAYCSLFFSRTNVARENEGS